MRLLIQRVTQAYVRGEGRVIAAIGPGVCVFLAVKSGDREKDAEYLAEKVAHLRIFEDEKRRMNRSLEELGGEALVISEFTLYADCSQGRRPSFSHASPWEDAERLYGHFIARLGSLGISVKSGQFRSAMQVHLVNDGPVTLILDSPS